ncbi:ERMES complex subunit [Myotisia sp. PD_48]|nr:ERMES complex subunit [Myotisia sp. PD_48]
MAFNFNWSPLMADAGFYTRAQDLLTAALNKSPKPPIIVGDIAVTELNLGSVPPELEILEVGDLAEDRFRGIFKMSYSGDAFLTLKTCVQANPLNTYMATRPAFTSPTPLAADHGLTIPLQITLSNIRLSGFVILVFSKQKGITLVFRNDPLESLKVSSTFDSIPFVRDYLQKEIEGQLRVLFMDELPAIIHRLSLRLWVPEHRGHDDDTQTKVSAGGPGEDPLLSPPQDPVDASGNILSVSQIASLSLDSGVEMHSLFSRSNLIRLATLTDSQRTLSLFTPSIHEVVFRALTGNSDQAEYYGGFMSPTSPALSRTHSHIGSLNSFQDTSSLMSMGSRSPGFSPSFNGYGLGMGATRNSRTRPSGKRKRRVVDLRRARKLDEPTSNDAESSFGSTDASMTFSPSVLSEEKNEDPITPPDSPDNTVRITNNSRGTVLPDVRNPSAQLTPKPSPLGNKLESYGADGSSSKRDPPSPILESHERIPEKSDDASSSLSGVSPSMLSFVAATQDRSILEQAFMMKLANEISRRIQDRKGPSSVASSAYSQHRPRDLSPPPAYGQ